MIITPISADDAIAAKPCIFPRGFRVAPGAVSQRHWVRQDPYATAFFNALSAVFPHGETFMIRSLMPWVERVPEPLKSEVEAFIVQEAAHSREHGAMNKGLAEAGYDIAPLDRKIRGFVSFFQDASDTVKLTATMCIEHFTAIIAAELLKNPHHLANVDDAMRELIHNRAPESDMLAVAHKSGLRSMRDDGERLMARLKRRPDRIVGPDGRRRLTRNEKVGVASLISLVGVAAVGVIAGIVLDRLLQFDDALDAGGEWDEGGGVFTRWD